MKVLHVITDLGPGGAEGVLARLAIGSATRFNHVVVSLRGEGVYGAQLRAAGVVVHTLNNPRGRLTARGLVSLYRTLRRENPDVVQTWMYHSDLVGGLVARLAGIKNVVWGIRHSTFDPRKSSASSRYVARVCAEISSYVPAKIACCSARAAKAHVELGYCGEKFVIIPNGFDLARFQRSESDRVKLRTEFGLSEDTVLIGSVARWDPQKGHSQLLRAFAAVEKTHPTARLVFVGRGMTPTNKALADEILAARLIHRPILAGDRTDIPAVMSALDLHVLASLYGEAFPNVAAEAMACGTPCIVSDVGDAAEIVGNEGWVVPAGNVEQLAVAMEQATQAAIGPDMRRLASRCRARIHERYLLSTMIDRYSSLWNEIAQAGSAPEGTR